MSAKMRLTVLGNIARRHGALTPPSWWQREVENANALADDDADWELALEERITGLTEILWAARKRGLSFLTVIEDPSVDSL